MREDIDVHTENVCVYVLPTDLDYLAKFVIPELIIHYLHCFFITVFYPGQEYYSGEICVMLA